MDNRHGWSQNIHTSNVDISKYAEYNANQVSDLEKEVRAWQQKSRLTRW